MKHTKKIKMGLCRQFSWTGFARINNNPIIEVISEGILNIEKKGQNRKKFLYEFIKKIVEIKTFKELWHNFDNYAWSSIHRFLYSAEKEKAFDNYKLFISGILNLPVRLFQFKPTKYFIEEIYKELIDMIVNEQDRSKKGNIFEALWFLKKLTDNYKQYRLLINGMVVIDPNKPKVKIDENEFDLIDLFLNKYGEAECHIYACYIADEFKKNNDEQLRKISNHIHSKYPLLTIRTFYVIPKEKYNWDQKPEEAGFAFH